jgi:hypothetical protein
MSPKAFCRSRPIPKKRKKKTRSVVVLPADQDALIWNAPALAAAAGCFEEDGKIPDERAFYYLWESGALGDAVARVGRQLCSTQRRLRNVLLAGGVAGK